MIANYLKKTGPLFRLSLILTFLILFPALLFSQVFPFPSTGIEWLFISGPEAGFDKGDDDHLQTIFLLIPDSINTPFKIKITGKENIKDGFSNEKDTEGKFELRIYGKKNVYLPVEYGKYHEDDPIYSQILTNNYAEKLISQGIYPYMGEYKEGLNSWLFRLEFEGIEGDACFHYKMIIQPENIYMSQYPNSYFYANNLSFLFPENPVNLSFFIPDSAAGISFEFFDMDGEGTISFTSNRRKGQKANPSGDSEYRRAMLNIFSDEKNDSLCLRIQDNKKANNNISIYWLLEDAAGQDISMPFNYSIIPNMNRKKKIFK